MGSDSTKIAKEPFSTSSSVCIALLLCTSYFIVVCISEVLYTVIGRGCAVIGRAVIGRGCAVIGFDYALIGRDNTVIGGNYMVVGRDHTVIGRGHTVNGRNHTVTWP